jgi:ADP-ribose pyrophosphatase YjhB (NUDIX family)
MAFYSATKTIIENQDGEILIVKEAKDHIHNSWDFPGGGLEEGEKITESAEREVLEETGYAVELKGLIGMYKGASNLSDTETIVFVLKDELGEKKTGELEDDIIEAEFKDKEKIEGLNLREENRKEILKQYKEGEAYPLDLLWQELSLLRPED